MTSYFNVIYLTLCHLYFVEGATQTCAIKQNSSIKNKTTTSWMFQESLVSSKLDCAAQCLTNPSCITYMINRNTKVCRLFSTRITQYNTLTSEAGYLSYDTCRATDAFGSPCSSNSNCKLANTICVDNMCQCDAGWSYSQNTLQCVRSCVQYGTMFTKIKQSYISGNDLITLTAPQYITASGCGQACVAVTSFTCLSFELDTTFGRCYLQSVTPFLVSLLDFLQLLGTTVDYYQRNCAYV
ncbi:hypothetical protein BgiMline_020113 [Biomphalaria glabrata]|nr:hypothetical protein BgiMline_029814 [Biomphalaria glabrata]